MPENPGACCVFPSTDIGELIPINASDQSVRSNQFLAAATLKPILRVLQDARSAQASYACSIPPKPPDRGSLAHQHTRWTPPVNHMFKDVSLVDIGHLIDEAKMSGIGVGIRESNGAVLASFSQKIPPAYKAEEEQKAGVGVIIRDEHGRVIASMADRISLPFSVDVVEAFAAKEALKFAQERGLSAIVLEGDSKCTIDSLLCEDVSLVDIGHLIDEAKMSGIGVGIRESNGAILASFSQKIPPAYKAEEIEALAALNALSFAFELGFCSTILKGDSVGLTQALKS
nr:hypothetical protein CFP56_66032 [Quercus suber]